MKRQKSSSFLPLISVSSLVSELIKQPMSSSKDTVTFFNCLGNYANIDVTLLHKGSWDTVYKLNKGIHFLLTAGGFGLA